MIPSYSQQEIKSFKEEKTERIMSIPGVNGCGVGQRNDFNRGTRIWVIKIYVESWTPEVEAIHEAKAFEDIPTDVTTIGRIELL